MTVRTAEAEGEPQISVSIVTYNNERCLDVLLDSLRAQKGITWEAFFFDNASDDRTPELIADAGAGTLHVSNVNVGYSRGHNHNLARCRGRYALLLNPDLSFGPDAFGRLAAHLDEYPQHAIAGPLILEGPDRKSFPPRRFYPGEGMVALDPVIRRREIAWLNGCCLIARRSALRDLGGFDEDFFLYQAETDLCLRARRSGLGLGHVASVTVNHGHRQSQRDTSEYDYAKRVFEGSAVFWKKHYAPRDVRQMARFQYLASRTLLLLRSVFAWLPSLPPSLAEDRLRARRDVCGELLEKEPKRSGGASDSIRILSRQSRLALEWVRQRRFPLDDY
jgi:N-acetylglucosaminyl-diphospho-decaprenol L-rhamnosyltransferase